ncbi:MAG TPA: butyrate kinase, partial [Bacteroidetes bacterium]|nr:butyrate kinase [Bacteroidota bacterium]
MGLFSGEEGVNTGIVRHAAATLRSYQSVWGQFHFRMQEARLWARAHAYRPVAVVSMGGLLKPVSGGTYTVNDRMLEDARANIQGEHASNLGCAMASTLALEYGCKAFVVDPVSVDEFEPLARYTGHPLFHRKSLSHSLNIHAAAHKAARELKKHVAQSSFIVAHLGGGISVAPVRGGRIVDVNDAASDGPFSPERTGGLPLQQFITLCFSGAYSEQQVRSLVMGAGGLTAYLGSNNAMEVERRIEAGEETAREVYEAMAYQVAKEIGGMSTVLAGKVDAVVITGGLATSTLLVNWIGERVKFIAPIFVYPGEYELEALALGALRVLRGEE